MRIIFVRHGEQENDKLTRFGRKQAKLVVRELCYENISKIYSSPLGRTKETAQIIAKALKIKDIQFDNKLREREKKNGNMSKQDAEEFDINYLNPNFSRKDPEGCKEYLQRIFSFLKEIIKSNTNESTVLIVGHSSMAYALCEFVIGKQKSKQIAWLRIGNCSKICFEYNKRG